MPTTRPGSLDTGQHHRQTKKQNVSPSHLIIAAFRLSHPGTNHEPALRLALPDGRQTPTHEKSDVLDTTEANGLNADYFYDLINGAAVVSFDVFDTVLVRPFLNPADVFVMMERTTAIKNFYHERIKAEERARARLVTVDHAKHYDFVRSVFIRKMHDQTHHFADFIKPFIGVVSIEELRETLLLLFRALVRQPTLFEHHALAMLPHNRELGASTFQTIGSFWRPDNHASTRPTLTA
ncbi:hypothetical protein AA103196_2769 [Ameyamaea chiangmaiensis NBRC 103196]|uniref:Uncharacterized protein n=1 Tax=Ameyamaea chiangmaiensis TaxID=442969 RepID=A0A850PFL3_9PROT|nr:hypothetical protein [Ameyamaea chiangmaiensis]MBS4074260.1 hypothetical protein [Ameyamaea chiangmaiensis]NVN41623.1 hypothetical protein [Ameyamaea chiangmaiensis]GBQ71413.1 hypothetical protein AA103196_2769 [Ameyamaea chiangmaiensis NBRC 103196]